VTGAWKIPEVWRHGKRRQSIAILSVRPSVALADIQYSVYCLTAKCDTSISRSYSVDLNISTKSSGKFRRAHADLNFVSARDDMLALYNAGTLSSCGRLSIRLSQVEVGVLLKRLGLHAGSHKQRHTIALRTKVFCCQRSREIRMGSPQRGRQLQVG